MMTDAEKAATEVILGVDTHLDVHVAVALDHLGRRLGELSVPTTAKGYESLVRWAEGFGTVRCAGVEGTSSYGAGITRYLRTAAIRVAEVERPKRRHLGRNGKSDPIDAEAAARAVLAGEAVGEPKSGDGRVEMIRVLRSVRQSAVKARSQAANQLQALVVTAPEDLRHRLRQLPTKELVATCARFRLGSDPDDVRTATRFALRSVARRYEALLREIAELDAQLGLNRGGNRDANRALYMICLARMRRDPRTKEYVARRTAEGKSKREIIRCLKRYVARAKVYRVLVSRVACSSLTKP